MTAYLDSLEKPLSWFWRQEGQIVQGLFNLKERTKKEGKTLTSSFTAKKCQVHLLAQMVFCWKNLKARADWTQARFPWQITAYFFSSMWNKFVIFSFDKSPYWRKTGKTVVEQENLSSSASCSSTNSKFSLTCSHMKWCDMFYLLWINWSDFQLEVCCVWRVAEHLNDSHSDYKLFKLSSNVGPYGEIGGFWLVESFCVLIGC